MLTHIAIRFCIWRARVLLTRSAWWSNLAIYINSGGENGETQAKRR